jgi:hypothetical protein
MRVLILLACAALSAAALAASAGAAEPDTGVLSVERGKGVVAIDIRGSVLGRLGTGSLRVTDLTPRDRFTPSVMGRKLTVTRLGPRTLLYRGQALRFRMLGGGYRIVVRGSGVSVSAVGRGAVVLDGDPRVPGEDVGVFSLDDGVDCGTTPESCAPLPSEPQRFVLGTDDDGGEGTSK